MFLARRFLNSNNKTRATNKRRIIVWYHVTRRNTMGLLHGDDFRLKNQRINPKIYGIFFFLNLLQPVSTEHAKWIPDLEASPRSHHTVSVNCVLGAHCRAPRGPNDENNFRRSKNAFCWNFPRSADQVFERFVERLVPDSTRSVYTQQWRDSAVTVSAIPPGEVNNILRGNIWKHDVLTRPARDRIRRKQRCRRRHRTVNL